MHTVVEKIVAGFIEKRLIDISDFDLYAFGLECLLLKALHYLTYILIAVVLGVPLEALIIGITFTCIRMNAGGYHAKTRIACYFISCFFVFSILVIYKILVSAKIYLILLGISTIILIVFSPVDNENKRLCNGEKKIYKVKTLLYLLLFLFTILISYFLGYIQFSFLCILGLALSALLVLLGVIKQN